jgi:hypothetical protein
MLPADRIGDRKVRRRRERTLLSLNRPQKTQSGGNQISGTALMGMAGQVARWEAENHGRGRGQTQRACSDLQRHTFGISGLG